MNAWLLQGNLINQDKMELVRRAIESIGDRWSTCTVTPFTDEVDFHDGDPLMHSIPYGSTALLRHGIKKQWPNLYFNKHFNVQSWIRNHTQMVNADINTMTIEKAATYPWHGGSKYFVRPNEDFKAFSGAVVTGEKMKSWMKSLHKEESFPSDTLICVSYEKPILAEWRWFVVNGRVIDGSMYQCSGQRRSHHENDKKVMQEAQSFANEWLPHQTCVMDTALYKRQNGRREIGVLEFNCLNGSGFYDHDVAKVVKAISESAQ